MEDSKRLVYSIIKFLRSQIESGELPTDACEGLEVSIQCLESAYNISSADPALDSQTPLLTIFRNYQTENEIPFTEVTPEGKAKAEALKNEGNQLMNSQSYQEAVDCYTKALQLDSRNSVYYCNRAAAHSKLNNYEAAIQDCKNALRIDPAYSKAYGRLGLAYSSLNRHQDAWESYRKALDLEPDNESYRNNLQLTEEKLAAEGGGRTNPDSIGALFTNPTLLNMFGQMLHNPAMQSMMNNIMSGSLSQNGTGMEALLQAGQQLAQQMQSENPDLVEQLKRQFQGDQSPPQPPNGDSAS